MGVDDGSGAIEVIGGLSLAPDFKVVEPGGKADKQITGGLSLTPQSAVETREKGAEFDPTTLLKMDGMPLGEFFGLSRDSVYGKLHHLQSLPEDNPARAKALTILALLENGKEKFIQENPATDEVIFR